VSPQFQYDAPPNPYVPSVIDLIAHQADPYARAALITADAQAQAQRSNADLWGRTIGSIGANVANTITTMTDPRRKIDEAQLKDIQARQAGGKMVDSLMAGDQLPAGDVGPRQESYLDANGLWDIPKLSAAIGKGGLGHLAPDLLKPAEALNDSLLKHQELQQHADNAKMVVMGHMAHGVMTLMDAGVPFEHAMDLAVQPGIATKQFSAQEYQQIKAQLLAMPPEQQKAALTSLMDKAAQLAPTKVLGDNAKEVDIFGRTVASNEDPSKGEYTINGQRFKKDGTPIGPVVPAQHPPASKALQPENVLLDGKPAKVLTDPDPAAKVRVFDLNGVPITNAAARVKPIPPAAMQVQGAAASELQKLPVWARDDSRPTGPEANAIDPVVRMTPNGLYQAAMNMIATGQYPPTGRGNDPAAQAQRAAINSKVGAIAASAGMDEPALRAFYKSNAASLAQQQKSADSVQGFMATADRNADLLKQTLDKLPDIGSKIFNQPLRAFSKNVLGDKNLSQFATYLQSVQNEYARIIAQPNLSGQLTDSARHEAEQLLDPNATVPQILGSIEALRKEGSNRLLSVGEQIQRIQQRMQIGPSGATGATGTAPKSDPLGLFGVKR
jgi:hypothetical protein